MDERPLLGVDHALLSGDIGHRQELSLCDESGSLGVASTAEDEISQTDEHRSKRSHGWEADEPTDHRCRCQRRSLRMVDGPVLGHRLEEDEDHHDLEHGCREHTPPAEPLISQDADQGGGDQLAHEHQQQHRVEESLRLLDQVHQGIGSPSTLRFERGCLDRGGPHEAGLGHRQGA